MGKTNYQTLEELTKSLNEKVDQLAKGELSIAEIETLTDAAKELYERLVIIRYKSYENVNEEAEPEENIEEAEDEILGIKDEKEGSDLMMFDFTTDTTETEEEEEPEMEVEAEMEVEETEPEEELIIEPEVVSEPEMPEVSFGQPDRKAIGEVEGDESSLNDSFKKEDSSLGNKFTKAAITNLKSHIGINRKFLYINDLFSGSNEAYNAAIEKLNTCESKTDAFRYLEELKEKQNWDINHQSVVSFTDIVERRYIN